MFNPEQNMHNLGEVNKQEPKRPEENENRHKSEVLENSQLTTKIREAMQAEPMIEEDEVSEAGSRLLTIELPHGCYIEGVIDPRKNSAHIDMFSAGELSGHGVGSRLMRFFAAKVIEHGISQIVGDVQSESAIKTRNRVFGEDRTTYIYYDRTKNERRQINAEQAVVAVNQLNYSNDSFGDMGVDAITDLTGLTSSDLLSMA